MIVRIHPSAVQGNIQANASKSCMQRACAAALLHIGKTRIINPGNSFDDQAAIDIIQKLGAKVSALENGSMQVISNGVAPLSNAIHCGESGLSIRMFTPIAALCEQQLTINGSGSLLKRPMHFFDEVMPKLSVDTKSKDGYLPLQIKGPLQPANITIDGSLSSQFLTGLLMAFAATNAKDISITVVDLKSKPYIDLTLEVLESFGVKIVNHQYERFEFTGNGFSKNEQEINYTVEGDWSGAAFLLVAGAIAGSITVKGLNVFSSQADKKILQALSDTGAGLSIQEKQIEVRSLPMKAFHFNATDCPDLFPPLVALAAYCEGTTVIEGVSRLQHKESNRAISLQAEFAKLGVEVQLQDDLMIVKGMSEGNQLRPLKAASVHSHHDHRIAMATAVAALKATGPVEIEAADAINKSYPDFFIHLQQLGVDLSITNN